MSKLCGETCPDVTNCITRVDTTAAAQAELIRLTAANHFSRPFLDRLQDANLFIAQLARTAFETSLRAADCRGPEYSVFDTTIQPTDPLFDFRLGDSSVQLIAWDRHAVCTTSLTAVVPVGTYFA